MLGKLLKFEFRATARIFLPFYAGLLIISIVSRLLGQFTGSGRGDGLAYYIGIFLAIFLIIAVAVITFVLMIQRFSKNLIGDEGYLMFTLPVRIDWLILSKLIASAVWYIASTAVVAVSIYLMALYDIGEMFRVLFDIIRTVFSEGAAALAGVQFVILILLLVCISVLGFYMCISLSMIFARRRGFAAVGFYIAYGVIIQIIGSIAIFILQGDMPKFLSKWVMNMSGGAATNWGLLFFNIVALIWAGALYYVTRSMLSRKLNLE